MSSMDFLFRWVLPLSAAVVVGVLLAVWFMPTKSYTEWDVALINAGKVKPQVVKAVLALPSTVLTTDTTGSPAIARQVVLKTEKDGEPFVAVLYEAKFVLLDNLTVVDTAEVKDTTG